MSFLLKSTWIYHWVVFLEDIQISEVSIISQIEKRQIQSLISCYYYLPEYNVDCSDLDLGVTFRLVLNDKWCHVLRGRSFWKPCLGLKKVETDSVKYVLWYMYIAIIFICKNQSVIFFSQIVIIAQSHHVVNIGCIQIMQLYLIKRKLLNKDLPWKLSTEKIKLYLRHSSRFNL